MTVGDCYKQWANDGNTMLTPKDVAQTLNISYGKASELMHSEKLKTVDLSGKGAKKKTLRVSLKNLNEFIENGGIK